MPHIPVYGMSKLWELNMVSVSVYFSGDKVR